MKILFDNQTFAIQDRGGISRYFTEIIYRLRRRGCVCILPYIISNNIYLKYIQQRSTKKILDLIYMIFKGRIRTQMIIKGLLRIINGFCDIFAILFLRYEIFHPTFYNTYFVSFLRKKVVLIVTVYDMIDEMYHQYDFKIITRKKLLIDKADRIIAISQNTKKDIMKFYNIPDKKISVVYLGVSVTKENVKNDEVNSEVIAKLPIKYLLYVGVREGYKNFPFFCMVVSGILKNDPDLRVVCIGGNDFTDSENKLLLQMNIDTKFYRLDVNDSTLFHIYQNAQLFIYPTLYEGFGMPILEAFAANCPVASSNRGSLLEVCGNAVEYFNPEDKESMTQAINNLLLDHEYCLHITKLGAERVKQFSWQNTIDKTIEVYKSALKEKAL